MKKNPWFAIDYYDRKVIQAIIDKYGMEPMEAVRRFLTSRTHAMLEDQDYGLLAYPERAVFDMWEAEQVTGRPADSAYIRGE